MGLTKVQADGINLGDTFAFTGTVSGADSSLISSTTTDNTASVIMSTTGFQTYCLEIVGLVPITDNVDAKLEISQDDGSSYLTSTIYGSYLAFRMDANVVDSIANDSNNAGFLTLGPNFDDTANVGSTMQIWMPNLNDGYLSGQRKNGWWHYSGYSNATGIRHVYGGFHFVNTGAYNKIKFSFSSGNIETGVFNLYGINKT